MVRNNAATSEQSAAAGEELSGQAVVLRELVAKFRLEDQRLKRTFLVSGAYDILKKKRFGD